MTAISNESLNHQTPFAMVIQPLLKNQLEQGANSNSELVKREINILEALNKGIGYTKKAGTYLAVAAIALPFFAAIVSSSYLFLGAAILGSVSLLYVSKNIWIIARSMISIALPQTKNTLAILKDRKALEEVSNDPIKLAERVTKNIENVPSHKKTNFKEHFKRAYQYALTTSACSESSMEQLKNDKKEVSLTALLAKISSVTGAFHAVEQDLAKIPA